MKIKKGTFFRETTLMFGTALFVFFVFSREMSSRNVLLAALISYAAGLAYSLAVWHLYFKRLADKSRDEGESKS